MDDWDGGIGVFATCDVIWAMVAGSLLRGLIVSLDILTNGWLVALSQMSRYKSRDNE